VTGGQLDHLALQLDLYTTCRGKSEDRFGQFRAVVQAEGGVEDVEAQRLVQSTGERWYEAMILWQRGQLLCLQTEDPEQADAMEAELRAQLASLAGEPPSTAEVEAARNHLLGRDLTAAQSNEELANKLAREFVETGGPRSHEQWSTAGNSPQCRLLTLGQYRIIGRPVELGLGALEVAGSDGETASRG